MEIYIAEQGDLKELLKIYTQLHDNNMTEINEEILILWQKILNDVNHYVIVGKINDTIVSSCVLLIVPNLTHNQQPYALIENVVTDESYQNKGYATSILNYAKQIAIENNCYKIMLMTGSKKVSTLDFYRKLGYNSNDKTAFIQWL